MKRNTATIAYIARMESSRDIVTQAGAEHRARELVLTTDARVLRLQSRIAAHRAAGRMQAAAAAKRMAMKLIATIAE